MLQAIIDILGAHGMQALSINGITEIVGILPSVIYRNFKNKDVILDGILELINTKIQSNVEEVKNVI